MAHNDQLYCGVKTMLNTFAKFVVVYETEIKEMRRCNEFEQKFSKAYSLYKFQMLKTIKYATCAELAEIKPYAKYTLFFNKRTVIILDLCRHLRNSFAHAILFCKKDKLYVNDIGRGGKKTSIGWLDKKLVINFLTEIGKEYEQNNIDK